MIWKSRDDFFPCARLANWGNGHRFNCPRRTPTMPHLYPAAGARRQIGWGWGFASLTALHAPPDTAGVHRSASARQARRQLRAHLPPHSRRRLGYERYVVIKNSQLRGPRVGRRPRQGKGVAPSKPRKLDL